MGRFFGPGNPEIKVYSVSTSQDGALSYYCELVLS